MTPNAFAGAALVFSIPLAFALYSALPPHRAAFLTLLLAALLLPAGYGWQVPLLQGLDKLNLPVLAAVAACLLVAPTRLERLRLRGPILLPIGALILGPMLTAFANSAPYSVGPVTLPGMTAYAGLVLAAQNTVTFVMPFLLGRMLVSKVSELESLLRALVVAFLVYSIPMLWEVRMSPRLHAIVYGYSPSAFLQQVRSEGFRPMVFIGHGLPLAVLTSYAALASAMLWRRRRRILGQPAMWSFAYLAGVLVLCKTLSAGLYAGIGSTIIVLGSPKTQIRIAIVISSLVLAYPLLRSFEMFPIETLTQLAESASEDRAESLKYRLDHEEMLLQKVRQRPLLGWGGHGRWRIFDEEGRDISTSDGLWIIFLGQFGAVGFLGVFGMGLVPVFEASRALRNLRSASDRCLLASMALVVALNWADSLPNALCGGVLMVFINGAFSGVVAANRVRRRARVLREARSAHPASPDGPEVASDDVPRP